MTFDRDELAALLLDALEGRDASPQDEPGTITTPEFVKAAGVSDKRGRDLLHAAHQAGLVQPDKVQRVTVFGDAVRRPGWRFIEPQESPN